MFKNPLLTRANISSYYIALLFSVLFFQQQWFVNIINTARTFLSQIFQAINRGNTFSEWPGYLILLFCCFLVVFLMRWIVVKPANLLMDDEKARDNFESLPMFIAVFGAFLYYVNVYFGDSMPRDIPDVLRNALGSGGDGVFANIVWNSFPIIMFFLINRHRRKAYAAEAAAKSDK